MIAVHGRLFGVEPNHGEIVQITTGGRITRVIDVSASQGHVVPTVIAYHHGNFYVGNLGVFPQAPGASNIWKVTRGGHISLHASGFDMVLGLTIDHHGRMYVLQASEAPAPAPETAAWSGSAGMARSAPSSPAVCSFPWDDASDPTTATSTSPTWPSVPRPSGWARS